MKSSMSRATLGMLQVTGVVIPSTLFCSPCPTNKRTNVPSFGIISCIMVSGRGYSRGWFDPLTVCLKCLHCFVCLMYIIPYMEGK